ncbi:MAG TPA: MnmC family methyltransferase [Pseudobdellovibrionaceae bacterium]|jgi:hypothetical protein
MNTLQRWSDIQFTVEITGDGSPSLRLPQGESMHHSGGAAEETELIYGKVIHQCFQAIGTPHFISVGLGLGYVELTVAREALFTQNLNFTLESFELVPELKEGFKLWLQGQDLNIEIQEVYDQVLKYVLLNSEIPPQKLKELLCQKLENQAWVLHGPLNNHSVFKAKAHCLLFDAFSAKTSPDLWTEEFLVEFFNKATARDAIVSTYASRTALKRALKTAEFLVNVREGFKGKRNSTLAFKGMAFKGFFETSLHS